VTIVVGVVQDGVVYMGADCGMTQGDIVRPLRIPKVLRLGEEGILVGYAGDFLVGNVLQTCLNIETRDRNVFDPFKYLCETFGHRLQIAIGQHSMLQEREGQRMMDAELLVGYEGQLWHVGCDFSVTQNLLRYDAIGNCKGIALGSLFTTPNDADPRAAIETALSACELFDGHIRQPFTVLSTEENGNKTS
jgi:hypothetical protein